jgi:hypothetical protein
MLDEDEDIGLAKAMQASLDDAKAKKVADQLEKSLQSQMGVALEDKQPSSDDGSDNEHFMDTQELDEPNEEEKDVVMADADSDDDDDDDE